MSSYMPMLSGIYSPLTNPQTLPRTLPPHLPPNFMITFYSKLINYFKPLSSTNVVHMQLVIGFSSLRHMELTSDHIPLRKRTLPFVAAINCQ